MRLFCKFSASDENFENDPCHTLATPAGRRPMALLTHNCKNPIRHRNWGKILGSVVNNGAHGMPDCIG